MVLIKQLSLEKETVDTGGLFYLPTFLFHLIRSCSRPTLTLIDALVFQDQKGASSGRSFVQRKTQGHCIRISASVRARD
jgi:hypothetical protein